MNDNYLQIHCSFRMLIGASLATTIALSSCKLMDVKEQAEQLDTTAIAQGEVELPAAERGAAYAVLLRAQQDKYVISNKVQLSSVGAYKFTVLPGEYFIGAFVDKNNDAVYQPGEPATYLGLAKNAPQSFRLEPNGVITLEKLAVRGPLDGRSADGVEYQLSKALTNIGRVVTLEDPMFTRENSTMGFWRGIDYAQQFGGGLLMLQEYQASKTPVVFVHGIMGTALEFKDIIASLDKTKYQPWVLQYPSGARLDLVSDYMLNALSQLQARHGFKNVIVIAHSMGGLMTRSFVMKQQEQRAAFQLSLVMTINSPLQGMDSAASGVRNSPIVVPSWRDVATGSDYVARVHAWSWPKSIPYYLIFSYLPEEEGDGVVPLKSQLSQSLQDEAALLHGFQAQHAGILTDAEFIRRFNSMLDLKR